MTPTTEHRCPCCGNRVRLGPSFCFACAGDERCIAEGPCPRQHDHEDDEDEEASA